MHFEQYNVGILNLHPLNLSFQGHVSNALKQTIKKVFSSI